MQLLQTLSSTWSGVAEWFSPQEDVATEESYETLQDLADNPAYHGKIVIQTPEGIYATTSEKRAVQLIRLMHQRYPDNPPISTVVPSGPLTPVPLHLE